MKQELLRPKPPMVKLNKLRWMDNNIRLIIYAFCNQDLNDSIWNIKTVQGKYKNKNNVYKVDNDKSK